MLSYKLKHNSAVHITATGHRGTDIEVFGFGVSVSLDMDNQFIIDSGKNAIPSNVVMTRSSIPTELPDNAKGTNILKTLEVK